MLHVTYEAAEDLEPGRLARIEEDRGRLCVKLDKFAPLAAVLDQLNVEMAHFLERADWYQLWGSEIASRHNPKAPIRLEFIPLPGAPNGAAIFEELGTVHIYVEPTLNVEQFVAALNPAVKDFLASGCWFQLYAGEIIDHNPESMSQV
ncbi:hypothetical protein ACF1AL_14580 [Streptomyces sp. NPDC014801]|uniref:hypothetical protein n=1 Tax=Streptomyces sp. NPDC014801 TaxID=3364916 RepID=UPI0036FC9E89